MLVGFLDAHRELGVEAEKSNSASPPKTGNPTTRALSIWWTTSLRGADAIMADSDLVRSASWPFAVRHPRARRRGRDGLGQRKPRRWFDPPISSVNVMIRETVGAAMEILSAMVNEKAEVVAESRLIEPELMIRETA